MLILDFSNSVIKIKFFNKTLEILSIGPFSEAKHY
jgi:hypothetical protein